MRLGLIIYGGLQTVSGGYLYDRRLVSFLERAGDTVELISLPWSTYGRHLLHNVDSRLYRRLHDAPYDLLLQDELNHPSLFLLNRLLRGRVAYPLVSIVHHLRSSEEHPRAPAVLYRAIERAYLRSVDGFICNSETTWQAVKKAGGRRSHVIAFPSASHISSALSAAQIARRAETPGPLRLLFVGNVVARKGLHVLLSALATVPPESWRLAIVGDTSGAPAYARRIGRQIADLGLADRVTAYGRLPDAALGERMVASDVLVIPSQYEGFGITYLEGMAHGLPAIATTGGAAHEIITNGQDGFLIAPGDVTALARCVQLLAADRRLLGRMSLAAQRRYLAQPSWEASMAGARRFLQDLATKGKPD